MRYALVTFLVMTSAGATVAIAQDGGAHGPPKSSIVISQAPVPTTSVRTGGSLSKLFQPKPHLVSAPQ